MTESSFFTLDGPLDATPSGRQMRAANFGGFSEFVRSRGGDPRAILERHGLDPRAVLDPDYYIDCKTLVDVLEYCSDRFNDPLFGMRLAQLQEPDVFGSVTALCRAAPTFRTALESLIEYIPVAHSPVTVLEMAEGQQTVELRWAVNTDLGLNAQANYQAVLLDLKLLHQIGGRGFRPSYINLAVEARPKDIAEIEERIGCPFHANMATNAIAFPAANMGHPVASSNRLLFRLLGGYLERVKSASRTTLVQRVEDYVRGSLPSGNCSIERCAKRLGTSVRTLQANLAECGMRFSDILETQRVALAKTYLEQDHIALDEVAVMLGYSEQSSFGRAFKRWTGATPQGYRANFQDAARKQAS